MKNDQTPAYRDGWLAHKKGVDQGRNPFDEDTQEVSHGLWLSGWCARFNELKHGDDPALVEQTDFEMLGL